MDFFNQFGFKFYLDSYWLIVKTKNYKYKIGIIQEDTEYYWYLEPYNFSYFTTKHYVGKNEIKKLLFAIKENEEFHMKKDYNKNKILFGDYNEFNLNLATIIFNELGYAIEKVKTGKELLEKAKNEKDYDIIFTNNTYQDRVFGKDIVKELKSIEDFKIPIIVCSVKSDEEYFINDCKFDGYINKPLDIEKVKPILDKFLK